MLLDEPDDPSDVVCGEAFQGTPSRVPRRHRSAGSAPARRPASICRRRSAPRARSGAPVASCRSTPGAGASPAGIATPTHRAARPCAGRHPDGDGVDRLVDHGRRVHGREDPTRRDARALQRLGRRGQRSDEFDRGQRHQRQEREQGAVERAGVGGVHAHREGAPAGQPGQRRRQRQADARRAGAPAVQRTQAGVRVSDSRQLVRGAAHHHELGCAVDQVHDLGRHLAAHRGLPGLLARGQAAGQPRHGDGRQRQRDEQDEPRLREEPPQRGDRGNADQRGHDEGLDHAQHDVLERVDVVHRARHEVAAPEEREAGGRQCLEALVDAHPQTRPARAEPHRGRPGRSP